MGRRRLDISQGDMQRALKATTKAGLPVLRLEVEDKRFVIVVKEDGGKERTTTINPLDNAPTPWSKRKGPK